VAVVAVVGEIQALVGMAVAAAVLVRPQVLEEQEIPHLEAHLKEIMVDQQAPMQAQAQHTA
jgi:hypothetical protein